MQCEVFAVVDCCIEPDLILEEASSHPSLTGREMILDVPATDGYPVAQMAHLVRFTAIGPTYRHGGGPLGYESQPILDQLGYGATQSANLAAQGVTHIGNVSAATHA